ncbi:MAG: hypothetical protein MJA28_16370 [Gammaproteobacteria bacterium]|nr:hypothetical protein [Gammaproteobacteria bacterium]
MSRFIGDIRYFPNPRLIESQENGWNVAKIHTVVTTPISQSNPKVMAYLNQRTYDLETVSGVLAHMADNQNDEAEKPTA